MTSPTFLPTKRIITLGFLLLVTILLASCASGNTQTPPSGALTTVATYAMTLPPGGQILLHDGNRVLFLGSMIQRKSTREAVLFDTEQKQQVWRSQLPGSAIKAIALPGQDYVLVTVQNQGEAHLLRLNEMTGKIAWDVVFGGEALDAIWNQADAALWVSDGSSLWQVDPDNGDTLATLGTALSKNAHPGSVVLAPSSDDPQTIFLASDNVLQMLSLEGEQMTSQWRFSSAKFIAALQPVRFDNGIEGVIALAHSHAYFVDPQGKLLWHIKNQDINYAPVALPDAGAAQMVVFGNFVKGVYLVDAQGMRLHASLPGGNVHILGIPTPIPRNILLGGVMVTPSTAPALPGYWLAVRSLDNLFAYHLSLAGDLTLIAETPIAPHDEEGSIVEKGNKNPNYPPFQMDDGLAVTYSEGIRLFTLTPEGAR